jgi:hypothetical protein
MSLTSDTIHMITIFTGILPFAPITLIGAKGFFLISELAVNYFEKVINNSRQNSATG